MDQQIVDFKCSLWGGQLALSITTPSRAYSSTISQAAIKPFQDDLAASLADIEEYLRGCTIAEINSLLKFEEPYSLLISLGTLGNSGMQLALRCPLSHSPSSSSPPLNEQRLAKVEYQNFLLKLKMQQLSERVQSQEERIKEIMDIVNIQMVKFKDDLESRIQESSLQLSRIPHSYHIN